MRSLLKIYLSRKMAALAFLGFASGLPLFLTSKALQAWMSTAEVNKSVIGLFSIVALPYSLKFLWSPLFDRYHLPLLGRRRGWLLLLQLALIGAIVLLSLQDPSTLQQVGQSSAELCSGEGFFQTACELWQSFKSLSVSPFFLVALGVAFLSATQDINADAYRTDVLKPTELGAGAAIFVTGYRLALIITGAIAFRMADQVSWNQVYLWLAILMGLGMVATLLAPEPQQQLQPPLSLNQAIAQPFQDFFQRLGLFSGLGMLTFIILYRFGDALLNNMSIPFLLEKGYSQTTIGDIQGGMGIVATIVGTLVGGSMFSRLGVNRSLWVFGGLQALSNVAYWLLSLIDKNTLALIAAINVENFCTGLATAGFLGFMMSLCNPQFSATQFALLSSLMAVSRDILVAPAGKIVEATGWSPFFLITIAAAVPGLILLPVFAPWGASEERQES